MLEKPEGFNTLAIDSWDLTNPRIAADAKKDWQLDADSEIVLKLGLRPIPVSEIGLYQDRYRATWPVAVTPLPVTDWRTLQGAQHAP